MPQDGIQSVTVPGAVDGWAKLHQRFGKLPWKDLFQPAIYYAEHGYPVTEMISAALEMEQAKLAKDENARKRAPARRRARPSRARFSAIRGMAAAFKLIAEQGESAFYRGAIAKAILKTSERLGGTDDGRRSERVPGRVGRADLHRLSRLEGLRAAAQRPGHRRARDAEHHVAVSAGRLRAARLARNCTCRSKRRSWPMPTCTATWPTRASAKCPWRA